MKRYFFFAALLCFLCSAQSLASNLFWIGEGGDWGNTSHWSYTSGGANCNCVPTNVDDAIFDNNSFSSGGQTVTIDQIAYCKSMNWTWVTNTPTLAGYNTLNVYGSLTLSPVMNYTYNGIIYFKSNATGNTIFSANKTFSSIYFDGLGGEWTLEDDLTCSSSIYHGKGTLNTNGVTVNAYSFASNSGEVRSLILGNSIINITLAGPSYYYGYGWNMSNSNLTFDEGTSTINMTGVPYPSFVGSSFDFYDVNFTNPGGNAQLQTTDGSFHNVTLTGGGSISGNASYNNLSLGISKTSSIGGTQTINGSFTCDGTCAIPASLTGGTISKSSGTVTINYVRLQNVSAIGAATFNANNVTDFGGNNGWDIDLPPSQNLYWIGNGGNWTDHNHWSLSSGGSTSYCIPSPYDNLFFDANSFSSGGQTVTIDQIAYCKSMNWTGVTNTPTLAGSNTLNVHGSLTLSPVMNYTYNGTIFFKSNATGNTIFSANKTFSSIYFDGLGGEWTLEDDLTCSSSIYHGKGTLNTNGVTVNAYSFASNSGEVRSLILGNSIINITLAGPSYYYGYGWNMSNSNLTFDEGTSTINMTGVPYPSFVGSSFDFYDVNFTNPGGNAQLQTTDGSFHNVTLTGGGSISGNASYNNLSLGISKTSSIGGTQTINGSFTCDGTCAIPASLTGGTISKSSGTVTINYVRLQNVSAIGAATFNANNVTDFGGNNGWDIDLPPSQNLYWIGNGGNWTDHNHWSLSSGGSTSYCIPSPYDNLFFDANSFSSGGQTVTIDQIAYCKSMNWTGVTNTPTLAGSNTLNVHGSLTLSPVMNYTYNGIIYFKSNATGNTIFSANKTFSSIYFDGLGGEWTLEDDLTCSSSIYHGKGTLNTNGVTVNAYSFASNSGEVRSLILGNSIINITLAGPSYYYGYGWNMSNSNLTFDEGTSTINMIGVPYPSFVGSSFDFYDVNFTNPGGNAQLQTTDGSFHNVTLTGGGSISGNASYNNLSLGISKTSSIGGTQTINGSFTCDGTCAIPASLTGGTISKSSGTVTINYVNLQNSITTGGATFIANSSSDFGNNNGWEINASTPINLYWIGDGGNWGNPDHWSLASGGSSSGCVPTLIDNVFFDANSFSSGGQTVTIDQIANCKSMNWTGVTNTPTLVGSNTLNVYGSLTLSPAMNYTYNGTIFFKSNATGNTIFSANKTFSSIYFDGLGGEWTLEDDFTCSSSIYHGKGTLNTNGVTVNAYSFASNSGEGRSLILGNSIINITLAGPSYYYGYGWNMSNSNLTFDEGTSTINMIGVPYPSFVGSSFDFYDVNFTNPGGNAQLQTTDGSFHNVTLTGGGSISGNASYNNLSLGISKTSSIGGTQTINGSFTCDGTCAIPASLTGGTINKSSGTVTINYVNLQNSITTGGATFIANSSSDFGNNNGWEINASTPINLYWIGDGGNWGNPDHWSLASGGSSSGCVPTLIDNVFFDANSFSSGGQTVTIDQIAYCKSMNWTGVTNTPTLAGYNTLNVYGSLTLSPVMNYTYNGTIYFKSNATWNTIFSANKTFSSIYFDGLGGEWTLEDDLTCSSSIYHGKGTLNTNGVTVNAYSFASNSGEGRSLILGNSIINITLAGPSYYYGYGWNMSNSNLTFDEGTSTINMTGVPYPSFVGSSFDFYDVNFTNPGGNAQLQTTDGSFHNVTLTGGGSISGNASYNNLSLGISKTSSIGGTQTINGSFTCDGTCAIPASLTGGTISKSSGTVTINYVRLQNVSAIGAATFNANNVTDFGGNNGWDIDLPPSQNLYWIGNGGNWTDHNHWSLSSGGSTSYCIPSPYDNLFFDANSFSSGGQTVTIDQIAYCKSMNWTAVTNTPTLAGGNTLNVYGSLTLSPVMNYNYNGTIYFKSNATWNTIFSANKTFSSIYFDGLGGEWTLEDDLTCSSSIYHGKGTLNTNGVTVNAYSFASNSGEVRSLILGNSIINITLAGPSYYYGYGWNMSNSNLTFDEGTSTINMTGVPYPSFVGSSFDFYDVNFTNPGGNAQLQTTDGSFHNVTLTGGGSISGNASYNNLSLGISKTSSIGGTQTINGTFTCDGTCAIPASLTGGTISKNSGTVTINYVRLQNVSAIGAATFNANNVTDFGGNNGWDIDLPPSQNLYWIGNGGNWTDHNHWSLSSGGSTSNCIPSPYDNLFFDDNSFSSGGQTVTIDQITYCKSMNWTGVTNTPTLAGYNTLNVYGSLTLSPAMNYTYSGTIFFKSNSTGNTIFSANKTFSGIYFDGLGGEWTLEDDFTSSSNIYHGKGILNTHGVTVNAYSFASNSSEVRSLILGNSIINIALAGQPYYYGYGWNISSSNLTFDKGTSTINMTGVPYPSFIGSSFDFYNVNFTSSNGIYANLQTSDGSFHNVTMAGGGSISGNASYNNLSLGISTTSSIGGTQTINGTFTCLGTSGNLATLNGGGISKSSGTVCINYVNLLSTMATGGASFYAGNSNDLGGNSGWAFEPCNGCIPVSINAQPTNQTSNVCSQATFSVSVSGTPPFNYQWYKNGLLISNANQSLYTTPLLIQSDNGNEYHCIITNCNSNYSVQTNIANLLVQSPCTFTSPTLTLSSSNVTVGQSITFSGSDYSINGIILLTISDANGEEIGQNLPITYIYPGKFQATLSVMSDTPTGNYSVKARDIATGKYSPQKSFQINGTPTDQLVITAPKENDLFPTGYWFDIYWNDFVISGQPIGASGYVNKTYLLQISGNNGVSWNTFHTYHTSAILNTNNPFTLRHEVDEEGVYLIRIVDQDDPSHLDISEHFDIASNTSANFISTLEWDKYSMIVPSTMTNPVGVAADSTSRILIRLHRINNIPDVSSITATIQSEEYTTAPLIGKLMYAFKHENYDDSNLSNSASQTSISLNALQYSLQNANDYWFWFVAPSNFTNNINLEAKERIVNVVFDINYVSGNPSQKIQEIKICRPALMFVHGLGGDKTTFLLSKYYSNQYQSNRYFLDPAKSEWYAIGRPQLDPVASFEKNSKILLPNDDGNTVHENSIQELLAKMHKNGFADNRVDYVCHSMGGCVGRTVINDRGLYYKPGVGKYKNYGFGFINKFISINTPHNGSPLADLFVDQYRIKPLILEPVLNYYKKSYPFLADFVSNHQVAKAIIDLQAKYDGIRIQQTNVRNHLIGSQIDVTGNLTQDGLFDVNGEIPYRWLFKILLLPNPLNDVHDYMLNHYQSNEYLGHTDMVVPESSQFPGNANPEIINVDQSLISSSSIINDINACHLGRASDLIAGNRIKVLLNAEIGSNYFTNNIPANTNPIYPNFNSDENTNSTRFEPLIDSVIIHYDTGFIKITSPFTNSVQFVDSIVQYTLHIKDTIHLLNINLISQGEIFTSTSNDSIQNVLTQVKPVFLGENTIIAEAYYDSIGYTIIHIDTILINVITYDTLINFSVSPKNSFLSNGQIFEPIYTVSYGTFESYLESSDSLIEQLVLDTNVIVFDNINHYFIAKDTGSTSITFDYLGLQDTIKVFLSSIIDDGVVISCPGDSLVFSIGEYDNSLAYHWQVASELDFVDLYDDVNYHHTDSSALIISDPPSSWYGYRYRCILSDALGATLSKEFTIKYQDKWNGSIDSLWENPGNWECNSVPDCNVDVIIPSNLERYPLIESSAFCKSIELDTGSSAQVTTSFQLWVGKTSGGIICPTEISVSLEPGYCSAVVNYSVFLAEGCNGTLTQTSGLPSGSDFPIGTTSNCFDFISNNGVLLSTCCFDVLVSEFPNPSNTLACNDNVQISVDLDCEATVTTDMILEGGPYGCYNDYLISVQGYEPSLGEVIINGSSVGQTLSVTVTDPESSNSCWGTISIEDNSAPEISCINYEVACGVNIEPDSSNTPLVFDNCGVLNLTFSDYPVPGACPGFMAISRQWILTDSSGNTNICDQLITILPANPELAECPANYFGSCGDSVDPNVTGYPSYNGNLIDEDGLCNLFSSYSDNDTIIDGLFTIVRSWTIRDTCTTDQFICLQDIFSLDDEIPIISCPQNYETTCIQSVDPSIAGFPDVSDNCNTIVSYVDGVTVGDPCESQNFLRTWTAIDNSGNSATCTQSFTLLPISLDSVVCPAAFIGSCGENADPETTGYPLIDGCPINANGPCNFFYGYADQDSITCNGAYITRTWTISDLCTQETSTCVQNLDFLNSNGQALICPDDILWTIETGSSGVPVAYNIFSACNCGDTIIQTAGIASGDTFPIGTTTNCFNLLDSLGATIDSCCFNVTVSVFCTGGGIVFNTQEQIDSFSVNYPFCSIINGPVTIEGSDITNLDGLNNIRNIEGSLIIWNNPVLVDLSGLDSLTYVGDIFTIANNSSLLHISGFNLLQHIGTYLQFIQDSLLTDISGFNSISSIPEINIQINTALESITGFQSLSSIQPGTLLIYNNDELNNLGGFSSLTSIGSDYYSGLKIYENNSLISLSGLENLVSISGNFEINSNNSLISLSGINSLVSISGGLLISNNPSLDNLSNLSSLNFIGRVLQITNNSSLINLVGLNQLTSIGINAPISADNYIQNNSNLASLEGLNNLTNIYGSLHILDNAIILNFEDLNHLNHIGGSLSIANNNSLISLSGLGSLISIGTGFYFQGNSAISNLSGLDSLTNIGGPFFIQNNSGLINLEGINNLNEIGGSLYLTSNNSLSNLSGIDSLQNIGGDLYILNNSNLSICDVESICAYLNDSNNSATISGNAIGCASINQIEASCDDCPFGNLFFTTQEEIDNFPSNYPGCSYIFGGIEINGLNITNLNGLGQIVYVSEHLSIYNNPSLSSLEALADLTFIGDNLTIGNNPSLISLAGLDSVIYVGSTIHITSNPLITNLNGLNSLTSIAGLEVSNNASLVNLTGLDSVISIQGMGTTISSNPLLVNLEGLNNVTSIGGSFGILSNPSLQDLSGLNNLSSLGNGIFITNNDVLLNLSALDGVLGFSGSVTIQDNPALSICNAPFICNYLSVNPELATIDDNAFGCDNVPQVQIACGIPVTCPGSLTFSTQADIDSFPSVYPGCTKINGGIVITGLDITNLDSLSQIDSISQYLSIYNNPSLSSLEALADLTFIGDNLTIGNNPSLISLAGLDSVIYVGSTIHITSNPLITNLNGLNSLTSIAGLEVSDNASLVNLTGLDSVISIQGMGTTISSNPLLVNLEGLNNVTSIGGSFGILSNPSLQDLSGLNNLSSLGNGIFITNNDVLLNLSALDGVLGFSGSVTIQDNPALSICNAPFICNYLSVNPELATIDDNAFGCDNVPQVQIACGIPVTCPGSLTFSTQADIDSFPSVYPGCTKINGGIVITGLDITNLDSLSQIDSISQYLSIYNNPSLSSLEALADLTFIGDNLTIGNNPSLISLAGLDSVIYVGSTIHITSNPLITNLNGLNSLTSIAGLEVSDNASLVNLTGLDSVTSIQGMGTSISSNPSLVNLAGLEHVTSISGSFGVSGNSMLTSLSALLQLVSVPAISIIDNDALETLSGLDNVTYNSMTDLHIQNSGNLTLCDVASICDYLSIPTNPATISGNALGCATRLQVENECEN